MTYLSREERLDRIERDDGDPDDTVYIANATGTTSKPTVYHDDLNCKSMTRDYRHVEWTREDAQNRLRGPCLICTLEEKKFGDNGGIAGKSKLERMIENGEIPESELGVKFPSVGD